MTDEWQPIETAPKDGRAILVLSAAHDWKGYEDEVIHIPPKVAIAQWDAEGTSWVDEMGNLNGPAYALGVTGFWSSGGGWFQPNEVTHWMPLPTVGKAEEKQANPISERLKREFQDREYRQAYVEDFTNGLIATQIKVLREQRGWTQERLAKESAMAQPCIARYEDVNYSVWTLRTLKRLARALDVRLKVSFETFGSFLVESESFGRAALQRPTFADDETVKTEPKA